MKFLIIGDMKDTVSALPPAVIRQLVEATNAAVSKQKKAGKLLETYWIPGWSRTVGIGEAKSAEEIVQNFSEIPMAPFMNNEVYPLADYNESAKTILKAFKAAEKMMSSPPR
jgi:muconolactone delta-isomerase